MTPSGNPVPSTKTSQRAEHAVHRDPRLPDLPYRAWLIATGRLIPSAAPPDDPSGPTPRSWVTERWDDPEGSDPKPRRHYVRPWPTLRLLPPRRGS